MLDVIAGYRLSSFDVMSWFAIQLLHLMPIAALASSVLALGFLHHERMSLRRLKPGAFYRTRSAKYSLVQLQGFSNRWMVIAGVGCALCSVLTTTPYMFLNELSWRGFTKALCFAVAGVIFFLAAKGKVNKRVASGFLACGCIFLGLA